MSITSVLIEVSFFLSQYFNILFVLEKQHLKLVNMSNLTKIISKPTGRTALSGLKAQTRPMVVNILLNINVEPQILKKNPILPLECERMVT